MLAKEPLQLTGEQIRWLAVAPTLLVVAGGFIASAMSDRISRKTVMQIGVISSTFLTLLIPLTQTGTQLLVIRLLTGFGAGFAVAAPFPIAAELMPAQHRRTYGAIYEVMLASAFTLLPFVGFVLAGNPEGFRLIALPGGLALGVVLGCFETRLGYQFVEDRRGILGALAGGKRRIQCIARLLQLQ